MPCHLATPAAPSGFDGGREYTLRRPKASSKKNRINAWFLGCHPRVIPSGIQGFALVVRLGCPPNTPSLYNRAGSGERNPLPTNGSAWLREGRRGGGRGHDDPLSLPRVRHPRVILAGIQGLRPSRPRKDFGCPPSTPSLYNRAGSGERNPHISLIPHSKRFPRTEALGYVRAGAGADAGMTIPAYPADFSAASTVCERSIARVIGPTPPGTGV
jgi:hypothetical protein